MAFKIFRKIQELLDVNLTSPADGEVLSYDAASSKWINSAAAGGGAPTDATYITQTANGSLSAEQALSTLTTGVVKVTNGTGVLSTAAEGTDYYGPGGTDVAVADGGTGASTAAGARTNLGLAIGTDVQAYDADLTTWAGLTPSAYFQTLVDDADALTARSTLGAAPVAAKYIVQTADSELSGEQALGALATGILKNTTTTGVLSIATAGTDYYNPGGTDVAIADGGTGASTAAAALSNLGGIASSLVDAKGDLLVGTADNTVARLAVGSNTQVLTADSSQAGGVKWATPSGGSDSLFQYYALR